MKTLMIVAVGAMVLTELRAEPLTGNVVLRLEGALPRGKSASTLELEFPVRAGQWDAKCFGRGGGNQGSHAGRIMRNEAAGEVRKLAVEVAVGSDFWVKGGAASYEIEIKPDGEKWAGTFKGTFNGTAASGEVHGRVEALWPALVKDYVSPAPGEHPRLAFRKGDLPRMKKAVKTPEGQAMWARFLNVMAKDAGEGIDKFTSWPAVGYGFAYQMTGEQKYADEAKKIIVGQIGNSGGGQDIHFGPSALGVALAYDLCYDGWDETFRQSCTEEVATRARELFTGVPRRGGKMGGMAMNPWSNHNGIRMGAAGCCALAVLGEKGVTIDAMLIADAAAFDIREYIRRGLGGGYYGMEGMFYKGMTMRRGMMHMLYAYRNAAGKVINTPGLGDWILAGYFLEAQPGRTWPIPRDYDGLSDELGVDTDTLPEVAWSLGWITVPDDMKPAVKWIYQRDAGLESGKKTFALSSGLCAPFLFAAYPWDVEAKEPGPLMRWVSPDPLKGHYVFRPQFKDKDDFLVTTNFKTETLGGCHNERAGTMMELSITGLGKLWSQGACYVAAGGFNDMTGPRTTYFATPEDRLALLTLDLTPLYVDKPVGKGAKPVDKGITGTRALALDFTGKGAAPAVIVIVDKIAGGTNPTWQMALRNTTVAGNVFTVGDETGPNLRGQFIAPGNVNVAAGVKATGGDEYFCVITIQNGKPPEIKVDGAGLAAKVSVGNRKFAFDGEKINVQ